MLGDIAAIYIYIYIYIYICYFCYVSFTYVRMHVSCSSEPTCTRGW